MNFKRSKLDGPVVRWKQCGLYYKSFMIVIYNRNDSTIIIYDRNDKNQYYKTWILSSLALARSVKYDCKLRS